MEQVVQDSAVMRDLSMQTQAYAEDTEPRTTQGGGFSQGLVARQDWRSHLPAPLQEPHKTYVLSFMANHNTITVLWQMVKAPSKNSKRVLKLLVTLAGKSWNLKFVLTDLHNHRSRVYIENVWCTL